MQGQREKIIDEFYDALHSFITDYTNNLDKDFTQDKISKIIVQIPEVIESFKDFSSEEEYRLMATKGNGNLPAIQILDPTFGYKLYKPIADDLYKEFFFECLMYCLIYYEMYFKNWKYEIVSNIEGKNGEFEITDNQLPHLLGLDAKLLGDNQMLNSFIDSYSDSSVIEKMLLLIKNYQKIIDYEKSHNVEIINYYKTMQKVKCFLLLGRFFNEFQNIPDDFEKKLNIISIEDNPDSNNQLFLVKKSNMNSTMNRNIIKILIQLNQDSNMFFARSLQSSAETIESIQKVAGLIFNGDITMQLDDEQKDVLLDEGLVTQKIVSFSRGKITLKDNECAINPAVFWKGFKASAPIINKEDLDKFLNYLNSNCMENCFSM